MCSEVEAGNVITLVYSVLLNVGESVLKMWETCGINSLTIAKKLRNIHVNFIAIAITFPEKNGIITFVPPLVIFLTSFFFLGGGKLLASSPASNWRITACRVSRTA
jgi:hypothetical protein